MNTLPRPQSSVRLAIGPALVGLALCLGGAGCTVRTSGYADADYAPVPVAAAPVNYETYPTVTYRGYAHYYVGNQWYYRDNNRWMSYRREPTYLYQRRPVPVRATTVAPAAPVERGRYRSY